MRFRHILLAFVLLPVTAGLAQEPAPAEVPSGLSLARIFGDHMVLQREKPVNVWGWADKGEAITVSFAGQTKTASAGDDRSWTVQLDPLQASFEGRELTVRGAAATVTIKDVLVGEVWLCGGQSNMSFPLWIRSDGFAKADADKYPFIRAISTLHGDGADPPYDVKKTAAGETWLTWAQREPQKTLPFAREWMVFGPECLNLHGKPFTAIGFRYAKELYERLKVKKQVTPPDEGHENR